ncbi:MAG TPA: hypothetical protein VGK89_09785 [Candidatus Eisenbacteria bacterium]|jgi:hypothetical protein
MATDKHDTTTLESEKEAPRVLERVSWKSQAVLVEQLVTGDKAEFIVRHRNGTVDRVESFELDEGRVLKPLPIEDLDALRWTHFDRSIILIPTSPARYGTIDNLDRRIKEHVARYSVVPAEIEPVLSLYVRGTWLADRSQTAPYLRLTGPHSSGKSRTSRVVGHLCRKPYLTNSTASEASLNRTMEMLGLCTTIIDENEYDRGSETQVAMNKMLRVGFETNGSVERCDEVVRDGIRTHRPVRFHVFGPKIICAINHVPDPALQSRCIPVRMVESRSAPIELPAGYLDEVMALQAMLIQYRLDHYFDPLPEPERLNVSGRLNQLYLPLAKLGTPDQLEALKVLIFGLQEERDSEAEVGTYARIAEAIRLLAEDPNTEHIHIDSVAANTEGSVSKQEVGYFVRRLGLRSTRGRGNRGPRWIDAPKETTLAALATAGYGAGEPEMKAA